MDRYTRYPRAILWLVREGEITIGGEEPESRPSFRARVDSFYLSKAPVTNEQYGAYAPDFERSPLSPGDRDPAVGLSYRDARGYCDWYARVSRKPMRLPTEIEWEYACRSGAATRYFWGADPAAAEDYVWDRRNSASHARAPEDKRPNPFGLLGMLGTVWEWTGSLFRPYPAEPGDGRDDPGARGPRVLRGGSFRLDREQLSCSLRRGADPAIPIEDAGFRVARGFRG